MATKVLITGASGLLGRAVYRELENSGYQVLGTAYSRDHGGKYKLLDLTDSKATRSLIEAFRPDAVVHCAAERRPDVMEKNEEKCRQLNVGSTRSLCEICKDLNAWVVYISSDYVFDGKNPPYAEDDKNTNPLNKYGKSKRDGEVECMNVSKSNAVLRVPVLYGQVEQLNESAVTVLFENVLKTDQKCSMSDYERRYPTHVDDLAVVLREMIEKRHDLNGFFHWSGNEEMTKYDMAVVMAELFHLPQDHIVADKNPSGGACRPYNAKLDCRRLKDLGIGRVTDFASGIRPVLEPWAKHTKIKVKIHVD